MMKRWDTLDKEIDYKNERFYITKERFITPRNTEGLYYVLHSNPGVKIVALDGDDVIFIKEYRYPVKKYIFELPGGGVEKNEKLEYTGNRELSEEVGYKSADMRYMGKIDVLPAVSDSICHVFLAYDLEETSRNLDDTEFDSEVVRINKNEVYKMLDLGEFENPLTASVLLKVRKYVL